ncbi:MAG: tetratricopeptide repeat protein [Myxococcota bacterium]|nr:tetratricopeptide repeat protein [Myxococcota bacterium]
MMGFRYTIIGLLLLGCAGTIPQNRELAFVYAVDQLQAGRPVAAASAAWQYLQGASPEDPRYDRAQRLLARSSEELGLSYAAAQWYLDIAQGRRDPELLAEAVRGLQSIVESGAYDEDALVDGYLASAEITGLPADLQAFIAYHQGLRDARLLEKRWSKDNFNSINNASAYRADARYVDAVQSVAKRKIDVALTKLEELEKVTPIRPELLTQVRRSLARLHSAKKNHSDALERYELLRQEAPGDPELLLEMAWVHYERGDIRRALGLLLALDAPIYADLIAPDRFLLEGLALRRLCQFGPARQAATRLRAKHGKALDDLYSGVQAMNSKALRAAARRRTAVKTRSAFQRKVVSEDNRLRTLAFSPPLRAHLTAMYARGKREATRGLDEALVGEIDSLAEELLAAEEGVNLILHELGVGLLRGRERSPGPPLYPAPVVTTGGRKAFFKFQGEFWTDELDDLIVVGEDRCIE